MAKNSVSRIVRITQGGDLKVGDIVAMRGITRRAFGRDAEIPTQDYRVTYSVDPNGKLKASASAIGSLLRVHRYHSKRTGRMVCFLPKRMGGERLTRTVEILPKRKRVKK